MPVGYLDNKSIGRMLPNSWGGSIPHPPWICTHVLGEMWDRVWGKCGRVYEVSVDRLRVWEKGWRSELGCGEVWEKAKA